MLRDQVRAFLAIPHKLALFQLQKLMRAQVKLLLFTALIESGVAAALRDWRSLDDLAAEGWSARSDYLAHVLALGVSLRAIELRGERYRLKSRLLRAASSDDGGPVASLLRELAHYHGRVLRELPEQIAGNPPPDYLAQYADLVAGASRIVEPFLEPYADKIAGGTKPLRILEIGCGSGIYLRRYARCNEGHRGIAIDLDANAAAQARSNVEDWGLERRFRVLHADIRAPGAELDGPFDLITSFQNVYYFDDRERLQLFRDVRKRLAPGGAFSLVSAISGKGFMARYYDVLLNGTAGCHSFPTLDVVLADLREAGFATVERTRLLSGPNVMALLAR